MKISYKKAQTMSCFSEQIPGITFGVEFQENESK
jgi:hypothetical protein